MKPILMDDTQILTSLVSDQSNGIGRLDCISAKCTQQANGPFTVSLKYPISGKHFSEIHVGGIIKAKADEKSGLQLFRINKISKPMNGQIEISANHITYDLTKTSVLPCSGTGISAAISAIMNNLVEKSKYPFTIQTTMTNAVSKFTLTQPQSLRACLGGIDGSILDVFGGDYEWDNLTVKHYSSRGSDNGVRIEYGKNLTDIRMDENIEAMYTAVMPYALRQDADTVTTVVGSLHTIVESDLPKVLNLDLSEEFSEVETITAAMVNSACDTYIQTHNLTQPDIDITVSFVPLWQTEQYKDIAVLEQVGLFDTVHVFFPPLNIEASAKVTEYTFDILRERYESIHLGTIRSTLASTIAQTVTDVSKQPSRSQAQIDKAIKKNTDMITGLDGGHKYIVRDSSGKILEEYWLDTDSIDTAVNVRKADDDGISFSNTGISGTYTLIWLQDGTFRSGIMENMKLIFSKPTLPYQMRSGSFTIYDPDTSQTKTVNGLIIEPVTSGALGGLQIIGSFDIYSEDLPANIATDNDKHLNIEFGSSSRHIENSSDGLNIANGSDYILLDDTGKIKIVSSDVTINGGIPVTSGSDEVTVVLNTTTGNLDFYANGTLIGSVGSNI